MSDSAGLPNAPAAMVDSELTGDVAVEPDEAEDPKGTDSGPAADPGSVAGSQSAADPSSIDDPMGDPGGDQASVASQGASEENNVTEPEPGAEIGAPDMACLSRTICAIKEKIRWQTPAWTATRCKEIATAVLTAARNYDVSPTLLIAIMINESDMNEKAARVTMRGNRVYAKDGGLMAIRCILDRRNRCSNGNVRGLNWTDVMNPTTNIALGARELAYWRGGGVSRTTLWKRNASGHVGTVTKTVRCRHKDHAYWAHYNHGPYYIAHGNPRHYPHRVAVIDHALGTVMNLDPPELHGGHITVRDAGKRERTIDRPVEARYRKLCTQIQSVGTCAPVAIN